MQKNNKEQQVNQDSLICLCKFLRQAETNEDKWPGKELFSIICSNIPTLFECIKIINFLIRNEIPYTTAIKALHVTKLMLQTCQIPVINLIEVYILPYMYIAARHHTTQQANKKFRNPTSTTSRLVYQYESQCFQIIIAWSLIKQKRVYQNQQMEQNSLFYDCMKNLTYIVVNGRERRVEGERDRFDDMIEEDWQFFVREVCVIGWEDIVECVSRFRIVYYHKLSDYGSYENCEIAQKYSTHCIKALKSQIRQQFKQKQNKEQPQQLPVTQIYASLMQASNFPLSCLPKLDMYHIFQTLDPVLTYPLNQTIFRILERGQLNLSAMKEAIKILEKLVRWGDLEAYLNIVYSEQLYQLGSRLLEVKGYLSINEGQHIFPEIKEKNNKLAFYIEFLNFLQIFSVCKFQQFDSELPLIKLRKLRKQLQHLKFIFPHNLSFPKIRIQFNNNIKTNTERNHFFFIQIQKMNVKDSIKEASKSFKGQAKERKWAMQSVRNSFALLGVLQKELMDLIKGTQALYEKLLEQKQNNPRKQEDIGNLREKVLLLKQQISLNGQQSDPFIIQQLLQATTKGHSLLQVIQSTLPQLFASKNKVPQSKSSQKPDYLSDVFLVTETVRALTSENDKKPQIIQPIKSSNRVNKFSISSSTGKTVPSPKAENIDGRLQKITIKQENVSNEYGIKKQSKFMQYIRESAVNRDIQMAKQYLLARSRSNSIDKLKMKSRSRATSQDSQLPSNNTSQPPIATLPSHTIVPKVSSRTEKYPIRNQYYHNKENDPFRINKNPPSEESTCIKLGNRPKKWNKLAFREEMVQKCQGFGH